MTTDTYDRRAEILKAMAHPTRLRIIDELADGEKCVCTLQEVAGSSMPTVSRHLSQMKSAGIVDTRREGTFIYYRLVMPCLLNIFTCVDKATQQSEEVAPAATNG